MENGPFIDDFPINTSIYTGLSMAMLNNQMGMMIHMTNNCTDDVHLSVRSALSRLLMD